MGGRGGRKNGGHTWRGWEGEAPACLPGVRRVRPPPAYLGLGTPSWSLRSSASGLVAAVCMCSIFCSGPGEGRGGGR